jgi:hypothetical protein
MITTGKRIPPGGGDRTLNADVTPYSRTAPVIHRGMVWIEKAGSGTWACSACGWEFNPSLVPTGNTIAEIKQNYEWQRDSEFRSHLCYEYGRRRVGQES